MTTITCRLVFRNYTAEQIQSFLQDCQRHDFTYLTNFVAGQTVHYGNTSDVFDERDETQFSFTLRSLQELNFDRKPKYDAIVLAEADLVTTFETFQHRRFEPQELARDATVFFTPLSKDIYPKRFQLQSAFVVNKVAFGNIVEKRFFAPTFFLDDPVDISGHSHQVFAKYLSEQRDVVVGEPDDIKPNMLMFCEHDREFVSVCFPDVLPENLKIGKHSPDRVVEIKFGYSAIRRLIVTPKSDRVHSIRVTFTFQLYYSPSIYLHEKNHQPSGSGEKKVYFQAPSRYLTWNKGLDIERIASHASCFVVETGDVDARKLLDCLDRFRKSITYGIEYRFLARSNSCPMKNYAKNVFMDQEDLPDELLKYTKPEYFSLAYAVQALLSRKGAFYDYMFRPYYNKFDKFLTMVTEAFEFDLINEPDAKVSKTVVALEHMLQQIDRLHDIPDPVTLFESLYNAPGYRVLAEVTTELDKNGYMRVRKVIVTPTRKIFVNPELIMGNRSLRRKGADQMLRIVFRDDNGMKLSSLPKFLSKKAVLETLSYPMDVGFRKFSYLCSSNSQLRDHGCYFLAGLPKDVQQFREKCGRFKIEGIPKMMSRIAQCFTQARQLGIEIRRESYTEIYDYTGGADSNGKPYTFSDGCGLISREYCQKIVSDLKLGDCLPSCYQIRFRGYKGVVTICSELDEIKNWAMIHKKVPAFRKGDDLPWYCQSLMFRPSQKKFHGPREKKVEIVKISSPILVSLNKPLINILDQVSQMQGSDSHNRICNRIFELLEQHLESAVSSLVEKPNAFLTLNEFPKYISYNRLQDFDVTEDSFFRSMLRSSALVGLHRLVDKMQIRIPSSQGRMMFGVVDETGILQYGQVFIQYTTNASLKYPSQHADKIVLSGPVMITKNPSVVSGDVRMFEAVDLPCLYDLVDVVVFPQSGPRPHPDEMAGSDLDGDEYSIFWDPLLFLDRNEPAFDFTATAKEPEKDNILDELTPRMINFFKEYVLQDSIGTIANAHLAHSDLYGINSKHCYNIAKKHNQAVDFSKSGQVPDELTKLWDGALPPEKVERYPNFMCKDNQVSYKSNRLLGQLYSRAIEVREIIRVEEIASAGEMIKLDEAVLMPGDDVYVKDAQTIYDEYCALISGICETYGILNEGQLFSGRFTSLKKRLSDKDHDDKMSLFNTEHMIEEQVAEIYSKFRCKFFDDFGGIERNTELDERRMNGNRETFCRVCVFPSDQIRKKASAYYRVAYTNGKYLSFGWLAADILSYNRKQYLLQLENLKISLCPLNDRLTNSINDICQSELYGAEFKAYCNSLQQSSSSSQSFSEVSVAKICRSFIGLPKLLFVFRKWIELHGIDSNSRGSENDINGITPETMDAIVVMFGLGELKKGLGEWLTTCEVDDSIVNLEEQIGGLGKHFWSLIRFLKTRNFGFCKRISLEPVAEICLESPQCLALYFAAVDTFYPIAVNRRFDCLPGTSNDRKVVQKVTEGNTFVVEILKNAKDYKILFEKLAKKCNCTYLVMLKKPDIMNAKSSRVSLKPVGSFMAVQKFRSLLEVSPCMTEMNLKKRSDMIAEEVYNRLKFFAHDGRSIDEVFVP